MNRIITTLLATSIVASVAISAKTFQNTTNQAHDAEQLISCAWFPICRDPDFQNNDSIEQLESMHFELSQDLVACAWFPICRDPDMPFLTIDEQSEAAVA